jgi:NADH-quinone oxidoreductase subunit J
MTFPALIFYLLAALILGSTLVAVTRRNLVHTVVYLVLSFFGTAMLFFLLGAPFLAVLEVIIYAGAIMILFLFILMMIRSETAPAAGLSRRNVLRFGIPAILFLSVCVLIVLQDPGSRTALQTARATPEDFGREVFQVHWLSVEIISLLLLVVLVGALHLGGASPRKAPPREGDNP